MCETETVKGNKDCVCVRENEKKILCSANFLWPLFGPGAEGGSETLVLVIRNI